MLINLCPCSILQQQTQFRMAIQFSVRGCFDATTCDNGTKACPNIVILVRRMELYIFWGTEWRADNDTTRNTQTSKF